MERDGYEDEFALGGRNEESVGGVEDGAREGGDEVGWGWYGWAWGQRRG